MRLASEHDVNRSALPIVQQDGTDKFRNGAVAALCQRCGLDSMIEKEHESLARDFRRFNLMSLAEHCLQRAGQKINHLGRGEIARLAFASSTSDFPYLLANVANKAMLKGFRQAPATWNTWCTIGSVPNFKDKTWLRVSESDDLMLVAEGAEYQDSNLADIREQGRAYKFGRLFSQTWETVVNDDMDELTRQPLRAGEAAQRLIGDLVYAELMSGSGAMGPTMGDGSPLFIDGTNWFDDADVAAWEAGKTSVLDLTSGPWAIGYAIYKLANQTGLKGHLILNISPGVLLIPPIYSMLADILTKSATLPVATMPSGTVNPIQQKIPQVVTEPRLSNIAYTGYSATAWYLIGARDQIDTCEVMFLDGEQEPTLEEEQGFEVDGRRYKVRHVVGVKSLERKAFVKSKGAA